MNARLVAVSVLLGVAALVGIAWIASPDDEPVAAIADVTSTDGPVDSAGGTEAPGTDAPDGEDSDDVAPEDEVEAIPVLRPAPAIDAPDGWLQSEIDSLDDLAGQVVIVQFWTYACSNCKATIPHLQDLYAAYAGEGLEIVGVHAPEFEFEKAVDSIAAAASDLGVTWPIALDTDRDIFHLWQESPRFWPRTYVVDTEGQIRFDHIGEGKYDELRATVAALLAAE